MPQRAGGTEGSSRSRRTGSCKTLRYRTRAPSSQVEEGLFGPPALQSPPSDNPPSETRRSKAPPARRQQSRSAPQPRMVRIITKDLVRDLRIPSKDPSGMSVILPPIELPRLTTSSRVLSQEERNAALESLQQRKDVLVKAVDDSNIQIRHANASRKKNQALSELDAAARDTAQHLLEKANALRMEQEDEVKKLNELILGVQCHAVRDAQILERKQIHLELVDEDRRQDAMMEVQRLKEIDEQEQMDRQRKERSVRGKQQILSQMEERREQQLLQEELKEQEAQRLRDEEEQHHLRELEALERKREQQNLLQEEIMRINTETIRAKEHKKEQEKMAVLKAMEYIQHKAEQDAEKEAKQMSIKKEREKEVARLRALQERDRDYKADKDELRARRARAAAERDWRRKQKEKAEKQAADDSQLKQARLQQVVHKEHLLAMEAGRLKAEFERELRNHQASIAKQEAEEALKQQKALVHANGLRQQLRECQQLAVAKRRELFKEREELDEVARQRRLRLDDIKERKLKELKAAGLPEKYCNQVERKVISLIH